MPQDPRQTGRNFNRLLEVYRGIDDLDWTVVSPAAYIHPGERTGRYRLGGGRMLVDSSGNSEVSAEDYAVAIADLVEENGHARDESASPGDPAGYYWSGDCP